MQQVNRTLSVVATYVGSSRNVKVVPSRTQLKQLLLELSFLHYSPCSNLPSLHFIRVGFKQPPITLNPSVD